VDAVGVVQGNVMTLDARPGERSPAMRFQALWDALTDVLGTAASATLLRRAAKRGATRARGLEALSIVRDAYEYRCVVPDAWRAASPAALAELRELVAELEPLLRELTGAVIVQRLRALPELTGLFDGERAS
jgi:hypothetical protein